MNRHSMRLAVLAGTLAASVAASAMPAATPTGADLCVVYPYYGQTSTPVPAAGPTAATSEADPCVIYPYYGETSTPVPGWTPATKPAAAVRPAARAVIDEWGVVETAEDLERVLAAYGRGHYLGL